MLALAFPDTPESAVPKAKANRDLRALVDEHFDFVWRSLRRLGLSPDGADDGAQQVFIVASRRLDDILPGRERAFLFATATRVASDARRAAPRRREVLDSEAGERRDADTSPDDLLEQKRARGHLDEILADMALDLRAVFVLFELEEMSTPQIAELLELPIGTVASRLRRAREDFHKRVERARLARQRGPR